MSQMKVAYIKDKDHPIVGDLIKLKKNKKQFDEDVVLYSVTICEEYGKAIHKIKDVELRHIIFLCDYVSFRPNTKELKGNVYMSDRKHVDFLSIISEKEPTYKGRFRLETIDRNYQRALYSQMGLDSIRLYNAYGVYDIFG